MAFLFRRQRSPADLVKSAKDLLNRIINEDGQSQKVRLADARLAAAHADDCIERRGACQDHCSDQDHITGLARIRGRSTTSLPARIADTGRGASSSTGREHPQTTVRGAKRHTDDHIKRFPLPKSW